MNAPFVLAACAEMLWNDRPMSWRLSRLAEMGFEVGGCNWPLRAAATVTVQA
ncbi:hypothetical protein [Sphaerotilus sp.]|uniref:hypothetical protein n=1 Tax=Sphaerotilus sp. TaxID=2093942 RepID=UPI0034E2ED2B